MIEATPATENYLAEFRRFEAGLNGHRETLFHALRQSAIEGFVKAGFPTTRDEEWRFTSVAPIARTPFRRAATRALDEREREQFEELRSQLLGDAPASLLVVVNGIAAPELSSPGTLPPGVRVSSLSEALAAEPDLLGPHLGRCAGRLSHAFTELNTAFLNDGAFVYLPRGVVMEQPVHLFFLTTGAPEPTVSHPRVLIVAEENSQVTVVETYAGLEAGSYLTNAVTEVVAGENAVVDQYRLQQESPAAYHVATLAVEQGRSSNFSSHSVTLGAALTRIDVNALLSAEGAECTLNGLYLGTGQQHIDNHTRIEHAMPHCDSHELYKGILDDHARGVFNGKIYVHPDAQKTDAKQTNKTLLLSDDAGINTKPQLEIFADDVRCTHGATVGQLDADALFYLRSRGYDREAARSLLTYAFASEVVERIRVAPLRALLERRLFARLSGAPHAEEGS